ncbi:nucleoside recognition membrane protein YjiH [Salsuginibacillus halophilus]|uniref:Nucleoside recognition membrane protein YjiH n=1 Tax=Salsuginibacillus halophilus TaxID=517424 RepID=A0A2P8HW26_9BACI|nr:YjiH family protein [Salsuginibacillus halophilus]PSL50441.1 nucleoside recognition membrane protein YjiH [Salsuginibacillus halophilus]
MNAKTIATFKLIGFSLIGIFLFMVPLQVGGDILIPVALAAETLEGWLEPWLPALVTVTITLSVLGTLIVKTGVYRPGEHSFLHALFQVSGFWMAVRIIGMVFALLVYFEVGPEAVIQEFTGGLMMHDLLPLLFTIFLFAGLLLPLLLNFGLLEFFGALLNPIMRPLFTLPGRSSIDSLTSWLGDGTIGVLLTNQQYEQGHYTAREAAVIGTTFSVVSITFTIAILGYLDIEHLILPFYGTVLVAGFIAALIMPRIPPLSMKKNTFASGVKAPAKPRDSHTSPVIVTGWQQALDRAEQARPAAVLKGGLKNVADMWLGVLPVVMAFGTAAVVLAEETAFFTILGQPFVPLLELMQVPEAAAASETLLIGFADMLLPALIGAEISSEMTRFIIGCLSVTQLIYLSEVGGLLLASKLPVKFFDLVIIFLERTFITLPVIVLCAHLLF